MSDAPPPASAARFSGLAELYDTFRPSYPRPALDAVLDGLPHTVAALDVGAGTGISSAALRDAGAQVIALEPNDEMRAAARARGLDARAGTADASGLPDGCVDLVTAFQAFHWFATPAALAEFQRVLRPGGRLAVVWNDRDRVDPFTLAFRAVEERYGERALLAGMDFRNDALEPLLHAAGFGPPRIATFPNAQTLDAAGIVGRMRSASYAPRSGPQLDALVGEILALHAQHADAAGNVTLRYRTEVIVSDLLPA